MKFMSSICNKLNQRINWASENGRNLAIEHASLIAEKIEEYFFNDGLIFDITIKKDCAYVSASFLRTDIKDCTFKFWTGDMAAEIVVEEREAFYVAYVQQLQLELPEITFTQEEGRFHILEARITRDYIKSMYNKNNGEDGEDI